MNGAVLEVRYWKCGTGICIDKSPVATGSEFAVRYSGDVTSRTSQETADSMPRKTEKTLEARVDNINFSLLFGAYALSGVSALIYQVAWQRILAIHSGVGIYSISLIVSAFMAGLGVGSLIGARTVRSKSAKTALIMFILCEFLIGAWGLISCRLYYSWIGSQSSWLFESLWLTGIVHFASLVVPTTLMGMSLPYLSQFVARLSPDAASSIGLLYAANIFGASAGALLTPWVFIRFVGIENSVRLAAVSNVLAGLIAILLWRARSIWSKTSNRMAATKQATLIRESNIAPIESANFSVWLLLYGVSGFFSLAFEVMWFRVIEVSVRATAFTFGSVLSIFLFCLGIGCLGGGWISAKTQHPLRAFLLCQSLILTYSGMSLWALIRLPKSLPFYSELNRYWESAVVFGLSEEWDYNRIALLYFLLPLFLYGFPTLLMGISFSLLQRGVQQDPSVAGQRVGLLQASNIVGNVVGSIVAGLFLIHWMGTPMALQITLAAGILFPVLGIVLCSDKRQYLFAGSLLIVVLAWPSTKEFWGRVHGAKPGDGHFAEDASGLMALTPGTSAGEYSVSMNGKLQSWIPYGGAHTELGALATIIHPFPRSAAIIGLGSGDTAWAAGCRPDLEEIHVFEICAAEKELLRELAPGLPDVRRLMNDKRVQIFDDDGRKALAFSKRGYDLIEADALPPQCAYAGNIYSVEFFRLCASRLNPKGLMCQWAPTMRTMKTFSAAFPYVVVAPMNSIVIGSNEPIHIDLEQFRGRLLKPEVSDYLGGKIRAELEMRLSELRPLILPKEVDNSINTDLYPMDEFRAP